MAQGQGLGSGTFVKGVESRDGAVVRPALYTPEELSERLHRDLLVHGEAPHGSLEEDQFQNTYTVRVEVSWFRERLSRRAVLEPLT